VAAGGAGGLEGSDAAMLAIVVADGEAAPEDGRLLAAADLVIAADGGARWLGSLGVRPQLVVGDLDSLDEATLVQLREAGTTVVRHPTDKEASDTELAVAEALAAEADTIVLLGALGGRRLDHELANLLLLVDSAYAERDLRVMRGTTLVRGISGPRALMLESHPGDTITLLPLGGDASGVSTDGLRYPLSEETLVMGRSRGLSNVVSEVPASVRLKAGSLLVVEMGNTMEGAQ
jgi:thiamine pyrophosphokinase